VQERTAVRTLSGIYAFQGLPGLLPIENRQADPAGSPATVHRFVIEVLDSERRFVPVGFEVELPLPYRGIFLIGGQPPSPAEGLPPGVLLYSAVTRRRPSWIAAVRGELLEAATRRPAPHALLTVTDPDGEEWHGLADERGHFAVWLPYPAIQEVPAGSPQQTVSLPLLERTWVVRLQVFYSPATRRALPGTDIPEYESVLTQEPAPSWPQSPEQGGIPAAEWSGELRFGQDVNARTDGSTHLLVGPEATSP
jgi:hypothetical protein